MQVYKEFSILSSRPNKKEEKKILNIIYMDLISVKKHFSAGDWLKLAKKKINHCQLKKKNTNNCWWNWFYFNAITKGISKIPNIDNKTRKNVRKLFKKIRS